MQPEPAEEACLILPVPRGWFQKDFINYLAVERGLAPRTLQEYADDLRIFFAFFQPHLEADLTLEAMDERSLRDFLRHLKVERRYSAKALNRKIACLKNYFKFLEKEGFIERSPAQDLHSVKLPKHLPRVLSQDDVGKLLDPQPAEDAGPRRSRKTDEAALTFAKAREPGHPGNCSTPRACASANSSGSTCRTSTGRRTSFA